MTPFNQLTVLVPGIAGSKLYCDCETRLRRLYPRRGWFFNSAIDEHAYECRRIVTKPLRTFWGMSVYDKFMRKMSSVSAFNKVEAFSYDWRRNPVDVAEDLLDFVHRLRPGNYTHLKLIGHSLGGLVIRIALEHLDGLARLEGLDAQQITVYQCGTPMYGSPNIHDYNYGFELAAILTSMGYFASSCPLQRVKRRDFKRIKPFLFSVGDLRHIVEHAANNMMFLLPTPMVETLQHLIANGQLRTKDEVAFEEVHRVHRSLAQHRFPVRYIFFFNISCHRVERVYIPFRGEDIFAGVTVHDIRPGNSKLGCGIHLIRLLKSDGLVVPFTGKNIPANCSVYVDESERCSHARLMNSGELWRLTINSHSNIHQNVFAPPLATTKRNNNSSDDDLPAYNDIE